jgi:hypothetical protein
LIRNGPEDDALQRGGVAAVAAPNPVASTVRSGGNADKRQHRVTREVLGCLTTIGMHRWAVERRGGVRWRPTPFKKEGFGLAVPREGNGGGGPRRQLVHNQVGDRNSTAADTRGVMCGRCDTEEWVREKTDEWVAARVTGGAVADSGSGGQCAGAWARGDISRQVGPTTV